MKNKRNKTRATKDPLKNKISDQKDGEPAEIVEEYEEESVEFKLKEEEESPNSNPYLGFGLFIPGLVFILISLTGFTLSVLDTPISKHIKDLSIQPEVLFAIGVILIAMGTVLSSVKNLFSRIEKFEKEIKALRSEHEIIRTGLADLGSIDVAAKLAQIASSMTPNEVQASFMKIDEKLNNLTKATRILTQPLEELSEKEETLKSNVESLQEIAKDVLSISQTAMARLEELKEALPARTTKETKEVIEKLISEERTKTEEGIKENIKLGITKGIEDIKNIVSAMEESIAGVRIGVAERLSQDMQEIQAGLDSLNKKLSSLKESAAVSEIYSILDTIKQKLENEITTIKKEDKQEPRIDSGTHESTPTVEKTQQKSGSVLSAIEKLKKMRGL